jgi:poly(beta-D-mannuronate) lyase
MKLLLVIFFIVTAFAVNATDHIASSAEEVNRLCKEAKAGDRVILKDGVYKDAVINFQNTTATKEKPMIFSAEHPGRVSFEGNSTLSFGGSNVIVEGFIWQKGGGDLNTKSVIEVKGTYNTLRDCALIGYNNADLSVDNKWVSIYGQYNTVTRCLLKDKFNLGATLVVWLKDGEEAHHTISYNYFLNRQNGPNSDNGLESIRIGDSKTSFTYADCVVAFNRFEDCDGEIEVISNKSCFNSYLHNTFYNNDGGLTLRHGNNCWVDGNVFDGDDKPKSYGVRIIGEGHVVTNNYFYNLKSAYRKGSTDQFRAPLTIVNGLENTPINGYFQVRRAVVSHNIFVNNVLPDVRLGARSKREGMTIAPDTVTITNNLFYDDANTSGDIYEDLNNSKNVTMTSNKVAGYSLSSPKKGFEKLKPGKRDGFDWIKDNKGNYIASVEDKIVVPDINAGANWVDESIKQKIAKVKYTLTSSKEVGPIWMR